MSIISECRLTTAMQVADIGLWEIQYPDGSVWLDEQWWSRLGYRPGEMPQSLESVVSLMHPDDRRRVLRALQRHRAGAVPAVDVKARMRCKDGSWRWIRYRGRAIERAGDGGAVRVSGVHIDAQGCHDCREAQLRLVAAEHLEAIGRLAAGVAHEINTPVQYVSDSVYFIREGVQELIAHVDGLRATCRTVPEAAPDLPYLLENLPAALDRAVDGITRIAEIVRSLKEFSHADQETMRPIDLNRGIQSTLVVARSEYRYVADVETDLADLPEVTCHGAQVGQVVLNLVVNAAHAIEDVVKETGGKGLITVRTSRDGNEVVIGITDTGGGIPEAIRHRIFESFFTAKGVGRGSGQGLAFVHNVIVKGHGGSVSFQTELGKGTTFFLRLPVAARGNAGEVAAA